MSIQFLRENYGLTCKVGQRVRYSPPGVKPREGRIVGGTCRWLRVQLDPIPGIPLHTQCVHPTKHVEYL